MKVLLDHLWFGNGVALSPSEDFVVVAESHSSRLLRVWLKGSKQGTSGVFFDGLPGAPDNLSFGGDGIWVSLATAADEKHPMLPHLLAEYPTIRKFLVRLLELILMPFEFVNSYYQNPFTSFICREFGSMDMIKFIIPARRAVINLGWNANVVKSLYGSDSTAGVVTHALKLDDFLYLGSVTSNFIARVKLLA